MNDQVSRLIELRKLEDRTRLNPLSKIISVTSGKGGTGKSFFALNLTYQLSRLGKSVLLADLDCNFPNIHLFINHAAENTLTDFFNQRKVLREIVFHYSDSMDIIFGDSGAADHPKLTKEFTDYFFIQLNKIAPQYDYIVLDSAAGADEITLRQLSKSDYNIVVATPEPTSVMDAYVLLKFIIENTDLTKNYVVFNKSESKDDSDSAFQNLSTALRHFLKSEVSLLGVIGYDRNVYKSIMEQTILIKSYPNTKSALEINELAIRLLKITQVANNNQSLRLTRI
ncbi:MAG: AAA family ATPase [Bacteroidota bacterium]|jgi:flagellar biosynthesis protein FlhG